MESIAHRRHTRGKQLSTLTFAPVLRVQLDLRPSGSCHRSWVVLPNLRLSGSRRLCQLLLEGLQGPVSA